MHLGKKVHSQKPRDTCLIICQNYVRPKILAKYRNRTPDHLLVSCKYLYFNELCLSFNSLGEGHKEMPETSAKTNNWFFHKFLVLQLMANFLPMWCLLLGLKIKKTPLFNQYSVNNEYSLKNGVFFYFQP